MWTDLHMALSSFKAEYSLSTTQQRPESVGYTSQVVEMKFASSIVGLICFKDN